jgi:hypothetical protein
MTQVKGYLEVTNVEVKKRVFWRILTPKRQERMAIQTTLRRLEAKLGRDLVCRELESVAFDWDAPHWPEACLHCRINPIHGGWDYCEKSYYNPSHKDHQCPNHQYCPCYD